MRTSFIIHGWPTGASAIIALSHVLYACLYHDNQRAEGTITQRLCLLVLLALLLSARSIVPTSYVVVWELAWACVRSSSWTKLFDKTADVGALNSPAASALVDVLLLGAVTWFEPVGLLGHIVLQLGSIFLLFGFSWSAPVGRSAASIFCRALLSLAIKLVVVAVQRPSTRRHRRARSAAAELLGRRGARDAGWQSKDHNSPSPSNRQGSMQDGRPHQASSGCAVLFSGRWWESNIQQEKKFLLQRPSTPCVSPRSQRMGTKMSPCAEDGQMSTDGLSSITASSRAASMHPLDDLDALMTVPEGCSSCSTSPGSSNTSHATEPDVGGQRLCACCTSQRIGLGRPFNDSANQYDSSCARMMGGQDMDIPPIAGVASAPTSGLGTAEDANSGSSMGSGQSSHGIQGVCPTPGSAKWMLGLTMLEQATAMRMYGMPYWQQGQAKSPKVRRFVVKVKLSGLNPSDLQPSNLEHLHSSLASRFPSMSMVGAAVAEGCVELTLDMVEFEDQDMGQQTTEAAGTEHDFGDGSSSGQVYSARGLEEEPAGSWLTWLQVPQDSEGGKVEVSAWLLPAPGEAPDMWLTGSSVSDWEPKMPSAMSICNLFPMLLMKTPRVLTDGPGQRTSRTAAPGAPGTQVLVQLLVPHSPAQAPLSPGSAAPGSPSVTPQGSCCLMDTALGMGRECMERTGTAVDKLLPGLLPEGTRLVARCQGRRLPLSMSVESMEEGVGSQEGQKGGAVLLQARTSAIWRVQEQQQEHLKRVARNCSSRRSTYDSAACGFGRGLSLHDTAGSCESDAEVRVSRGGSEEADGPYCLVTLRVDLDLAGVLPPCLVLLELWQGGVLVGWSPVLVLDLEWSAVYVELADVQMQQQAQTAKEVASVGMARAALAPGSPGVFTSLIGPRAGREGSVSDAHLTDFIHKLGSWLEFAVQKELSMKMAAAEADAKYAPDMRGADCADASGVEGGEQAPQSQAAAAAALGTFLHSAARTMSAKDVRYQRLMVNQGKQLLWHAVVKGWHASGAALLKQLMGPACSCSFKDVSMTPEGTTLFHLAVRSGSAATVKAVVKWGQQQGQPWSWRTRAQGSITPLHVAAALPDGGLLAAQILQRSRAAAQAWNKDTTHAGLTPAELAALHQRISSTTQHRTTLPTAVSRLPTAPDGAVAVEPAGAVGSTVRSAVRFRHGPAARAEVQRQAWPGPPWVLPPLGRVVSPTESELSAAQSQAPSATAGSVAAVECRQGAKPAAAVARQQSVAWACLRGFVDGGNEAEYRNRVGRAVTPLAVTWSALMVVMITLSCIRSLVYGNGAAELPALLVWLSPYVFVAAAGLRKRYGSLEWCFLVCGLGRALSELLMGLRLVAVPDAVMLVFHNKMEFVTEPLLYTPMEQMRTPFVILHRCLSLVAYNHLYAACGIANGTAKSLTMNLMGLVVGVGLDAMHRHSFMQLLKQRRAALAPGASAIGSPQQLGKLKSKSSEQME